MMLNWEREINSWDLKHLEGNGRLPEKGLEAPDLEKFNPPKKRDLTRRGNLTRYTTYTYVFEPEDGPSDTVITKQTLLINEWKDITTGDFAQQVLTDKDRGKGLDNDGVGVV